jgi:hypothetical protein
VQDTKLLVHDDKVQLWNNARIRMAEQTKVDWRRKTGRLSIKATSAGNLFKTIGPDTGNARAPTVERRISETV